MVIGGINIKKNQLMNFENYEIDFKDQASMFRNYLNQHITFHDPGKVNLGV